MTKHNLSIITPQNFLTLQHMLSITALLLAYTEQGGHWAVSIHSISIIIIINHLYTDYLQLYTSKK